MNLEDIKNLKEKLEAVVVNITAVQDDVERNSADITSLGVRGHWCGYQSYWDTLGTITYDSITFSDSNMNITGTPLDIDTGNNSHKCYYLSGY